MRTKKICRYIAFTAILTTSGCSLVGPECQRIKLSEIFKKNVTYEDPNKEWFELMDRNDGVQYYWFKDKYYTETQLDSIMEVLHVKITEEMIRELDSTNLKHK